MHKEHTYLVTWFSSPVDGSATRIHKERVKAHCEEEISMWFYESYGYEDTRDDSTYSLEIVEVN